MTKRTGPPTSLHCHHNYDYTVTQAILIYGEKIRLWSHFSNKYIWLTFFTTINSETCYFIKHPTCRLYCKRISRDILYIIEKEACLHVQNNITTVCYVIMNFSVWFLFWWHIILRYCTRIPVVEDVQTSTNNPRVTSTLFLIFIWLAILKLFVTWRGWKPIRYTLCTTTFYVQCHNNNQHSQIFSYFLINYKFNCHGLETSQCIYVTSKKYYKSLRIIFSRRVNKQEWKKDFPSWTRDRLYREDCPPDWLIYWSVVSSRISYCPKSAI